jgi:anti-anti-sigma regulatory factor
MRMIIDVVLLFHQNLVIFAANLKFEQSISELWALLPNFGVMIDLEEVTTMESILGQLLLKLFTSNN